MIHSCFRAVIPTMVFAAISHGGCVTEFDLGSGTSSSEQPFDAGDAKAVTPLTIATYNVENFDRGGDGAPVYSAVARFAVDAEIDVLVLQEIQTDGDGDDPAAFTSALERLSYDLSYHSITSMSDGFNAIGVWSRFPLSDAAEILPENTRTVLHFSIALEQHRVWFFGCHLKSGDDETSEVIRRNEAARLERYVSAHRDPAREHLVVLGDMNTMSASDWLEGGTLDHLTLRFENPDDGTTALFATNATDLSESWTFPATRSVLDHILLSSTTFEHYVPGSVRVAEPKDERDHPPSDHRPVVITLWLD